MLSDRQLVELFHLHFLRLLCTGPEKGRFSVKGGGNLRFFFESVRYSEDLDLDVAALAVHKAQDRVNAILKGKPMGLALRSVGAAIDRASAPKQTETTQRWKIGLAVEGRSEPLHTKIELSRRATGEPIEVAPVASSVLDEYYLMPLLAPHYPLEAAMRQKVQALVGRSAVQSRDVFDLAWLFARAGGRTEPLTAIRDQIPRAIDRAMDVSFDEYRAQVASYLKPAELDAYGTRASWDAIQTRVVELLERAVA